MLFQEKVWRRFLLLLMRRLVTADCCLQLRNAALWPLDPIGVPLVCLLFTSFFGLLIMLSVCHVRSYMRRMMWQSYK